MSKTFQILKNHPYQQIFNHDDSLIYQNSNDTQKDKDSKAYKNLEYLVKSTSFNYIDLNEKKNDFANKKSNDKSKSDRQGQIVSLSTKLDSASQSLNLQSMIKQDQSSYYNQASLLDNLQEQYYCQYYNSKKKNQKIDQNSEKIRSNSVFQRAAILELQQGELPTKIMPCKCPYKGQEREKNYKIKIYRNGSVEQKSSEFDCWNQERKTTKRMTLKEALQKKFKTNLQEEFLDNSAYLQQGKKQQSIQIKQKHLFMLRENFHEYVEGLKNSNFNYNQIMETLFKKKQQLIQKQKLQERLHEKDEMRLMNQSTLSNSTSTKNKTITNKLNTRFRKESSKESSDSPRLIEKNISPELSPQVSPQKKYNYQSPHQSMTKIESKSMSLGAKRKNQFPRKLINSTQPKKSFSFLNALSKIQPSDFKCNDQETITESVTDEYLDDVPLNLESVKKVRGKMFMKRKSATNEDINLQIQLGPHTESVIQLAKQLKQHLDTMVVLYKNEQRMIQQLLKLIDNFQKLGASIRTVMCLKGIFFSFDLKKLKNQTLSAQTISQHIILSKIQSFDSNGNLIAPKINLEALKILQEISKTLQTLTYQKKMQLLLVTENESKQIIQSYVDFKNQYIKSKIPEKQPYISDKLKEFQYIRTVIGPECESFNLIPHIQVFHKKFQYHLDVDFDLQERKLNSAMQDIIENIQNELRQNERQKILGKKSKNSVNNSLDRPVIF